MHSIEEYVGRLWENFPPATILCGLVSDNLEIGFLIINIGLFIFGCWSAIFPIRGTYPFAKFILWFWIALELINGIAHPIWSILQGGYTPGIITAPILLFLALLLLSGQRSGQQDGILS